MSESATICKYQVVISGRRERTLYRIRLATLALSSGGAGALVALALTGVL